MNRKDVVVVGGGLNGCAIAWKLAERGAQVRILEAAQPGSGATWAAAGMLAPLIESHNEDFRKLATESLARFPQFVDALRTATGIDADLMLTGKIDVAFKEDDWDLLRASYGSPLPATVHEIDISEARALEPALASSIAHAIHAHGDGSVDNRKLMAAATTAARTLGVEFKTDAPVDEIVCDESGVREILLVDGGRVSAAAVVICAGAWSGQIALPRAVPVFPVRGQMLSVKHASVRLQRIVMSSECYLVPRRDGRILIGATVERVGFDPRTTAEGLSELRGAALRLVPALADADVLDTWAGLRPGSSDELPILGADPRVPGLFYATGHFRNGILLAPITADILTSAIMDESMPALGAPFSISRFYD